MKAKKIPQNYMDLVFSKNQMLAWRTKACGDGKSEIVEIDMENKGFFNFLSQRFFKRPKISHISLDKYGTTLWLSLDGKNSVNDILAKMHESFPDEKEKMLSRVVHFLATLEKLGFILRDRQKY
ncbi:MAG: PqqD family protein [Treponema sp.]|nr:PqqD family protein [Treponema sp.]